MAGFVLTVAEGATAVSWRWVLVEADSGRPVVDFEARLDPGAFEYAGFEDLYRFVRWNADPQNRPTSEAALVAQVGAWVGQHVLGGDLGEWLVDAAPVTVRVVLPPVLGFLVYRPLELAHVDGQALAAQDVSFVYEFTDPTATGGGLGKAPVGDAVRVLGVFSLPTGASVLGLRQERYALARLVSDLGARSGRAVELAVLQYGVTRQRLRDTARDGDGWDVIHLSGHGTAGGFALEGADGSTDLVDAAELVRLLRPARPRVKLAVVSACESGAASAAEAMRLLGLTEQAQVWDQTATTQATQPTTAGGGVGVGSAPVGGVARELGLKLGCPVVAMRFPVGDAFAIAFGARFYTALLGQGQPVAAAASIALTDTIGGGVGAPAVSLAVPAVFGAGAQDLRLLPPTRPTVLDTTRVKMQTFPPEADRFVGRTREMITCSQVLAPGSGRAGVLVHGMAGAGKTAIAVETAYAHRDSFAALAYWEGPKTPDGVFHAMESLAAALDIQLGPGFAMADKVTTLQKLQEFLPRLTQLLEENGVLLVLDNLEHLLDERAVWRDPRWATLLTALTGHRGQSRVILTSRVVPTGLDPARVAVVPVHALSLAESLLLARELPGLNTLLSGGDPYAGGDVAPSRALLRETLAVVQGHPKLLVLADAAATRGLLDGQVAAARAAAATGGAAVEAFLTTGDSTWDPDAFGAQLGAWTATATTGLPPGSRLLLEVLCFLEESDRDSDVLDGNWSDIWTRLHPDDGHAPDLDQAVHPLVDAALVDSQTLHPAGPDEPPLVSYRVHPGVADAVRAHAPQGVQDAVDTEAAAYWTALADLARNREGGEAGGLVVRAGLAAAPYLIRLKAWATASALLEDVLTRDSSPGTVRAVIPTLRLIADITGTPIDLGVLGAALRFVDLAEAEETLRRALAGAEDAADHRLASAWASQLVNVLRARGRLHEALDLTETQAEHTRLAGLGEADQITDTAQRLQILGQLGQHRQVLDEVHALLPRLKALPTQQRQDETIAPWNVRETTLDIGRSAALDLGEWQTALDLNAEILTSRRNRGAGPREIARTRFNDYGPLLRLGRLDEADALLKDCQLVFEDTNDTASLGLVLSSRAQVEAGRGHSGQAVEFERIALRYKYVARDWDGIAASHNNLAGYLRDTGAPTAQWVGHRVGAALIRFSTQGPTASSMRTLAEDLVDHPVEIEAALPPTFADLAARVETIDGVHLTELITTITGTVDPTALDDLLTHTLTAARDLISQVTTERQAGLATWEPRIAAVVAAAHGDTDAAQAVEPVLTRLAETEDWRALVGVLRRIIAGERGDNLAAGLDRVDTAIITRTLDALAGRIELTATPTDLTDQTEIPRWWEPVIATVVAATRGDTDAARAIEPELTRLAEESGWPAAVRVLRRIIAGERGADLTTALDRVDTAIITRTLDALSGRIELTATPADLPIDGDIPPWWEPRIAAVVAAAGGDAQAVAVLEPELTRLADQAGWGQVVAALRRIIARERDPNPLTTDLDPVDTAIITRTLDALAGRVDLTASPADLNPPAQVPAELEPLLAAVVAAARGDDDHARDVEEVLTAWDADPATATLAGALRRVVAGDRDPDQLTTGLHPVEAAILTRTLDALAGRIELTATPADLPIDGDIPPWWEPRIAAVVAAAGGDQETAASLDPELTRLADEAGWGAVVAVLRRIITGERDHDQLTTGLDPVDTAIATRTLDALAGRIQLTATPADLNPPVQVPAELEPLLVAVVAAARGDHDQARDVEEVLTAWVEDRATAAIAGALRRVVAGERDPNLLNTGLSPVEAAIITRTLDALAGRAELTTPTPADVADVTEIPRWWEERIAAVVAAAHGDEQAAAVLEPELTRLADEAGWGQVVAALRRVIAGERGADLITGLDGVDTAIITRTLDALAGRIQLTATPTDLPGDGGIPAWWEPRIAAIVAAAHGDEEVAAVLEPELTRLADDAGWGQVVAVLRRIIAGERDPNPLTDDLDPVDTAITTRTLDALAGRIELTAAPIGTAGQPPDTGAEAEAEAEAEEMAQQLVSVVVAAARGDGEASSALEPVLTSWADEPSTASLAGAVRRVLAGERDPVQLTTGLDGFETTIITRTLDDLTGPAANEDEDGVDPD